jgi:hypothetical protein
MSGRPTTRSVDLAALLLGRADLDTTPTIDPAEQAHLLAVALDRWPPPAAAHGQLLVAALVPGPTARSPEEHAVRRVVQGGRCPTPRAVAGEVAVQAHAAHAWKARCDRLRQTVDVDGPAAVAQVERLWASRGKPPRPLLLAAACGWRDHDVRAQFFVLLEAGWLAFDRGRLVPGARPGPRGRRRARARANRETTTVGTKML